MTHTAVPHVHWTYRRPSGYQSPFWWPTRDGAIDAAFHDYPQEDAVEVFMPGLEEVAERITRGEWLAATPRPGHEPGS